MSATTVTLRIVAEPLAAIRQLFTHVEVHRSTTGIFGTYTEITAPATRPPLDPGKTIYEFADTTGDTTYFYRYRFSNANTSATGPFTDPVSGIGLASDWVLTVDELLSFYLFGIDLTDDDGNPYPVEQFKHYIAAAIARTEKELDIDILPKSRVEEYDYYRSDYENWMQVVLDGLPLRSVNEVAVKYPGQADWTAYPTEWIRMDQDQHAVRLVPQSGALSNVILGAGGGFMSLVYGAYDHYPHLLRVKYDSGFAAGSVPSDIKDMIGMLAAMGPLNIAGDLLVGAGIASTTIGVPGLNQSINTTSSATNAGYGARILSYQKQLKTLKPYLKAYYHGVGLRGGGA